tara:strand:+ start:30513 stop:30803 length:291 start_codon:yes stop_codon:yes gene_type:complete
MKIIISSWIKTPMPKTDYVRLNGEFLPFESHSETHDFVCADIEEGDELDARGSGRPLFQSWCRFAVRDGTLVALEYHGHDAEWPEWARPLTPDTAQ